MTLIGSDRFTIIVGLGKTGLSCARFLEARGEYFGVVDTREQPPLLAEFKARYPAIPLECGPLQPSTLCRASRLIVSPGVARRTAAIAEAEASGVEVLGDIDLFCQEVAVPIVAITGSNAKSTVTTLVGEMAKTAAIEVGVAGNIGTPVLDLLVEQERQRPKQLYVLELSSFQLETTSALRAAVATVLNVSADHMDRYTNLIAYHQAKQRIYQGCAKAVFNADDALTQPLIADSVPRCRFGLGRPNLNDFGVIEEQGRQYLAKGLEKLLPVAELKLPGQHNVANALAALALGDAVAIPMAAMLETLKQFRGLPHRCQWVRELHGVNYFNDSKGTNVGATVAAIKGFATQQHAAGAGRLVLIAGGDGKGADFSALKAPLVDAARAVILIGRDREAIASALTPELTVYREDSLAAAVERARELAEAGDIVLLSPACASFDMFSGFEQRGDQFMALVEGLA